MDSLLPFLVGVGIMIAHDPLHGSGRADFPHPALTSGNDAHAAQWIRMIMAQSASEVFIVDNSNSEWKVWSYLSEWCDLSIAIDIATGYFEIGSLLCLQGKWQSVDHIRILMGDEVSFRTKRAFADGLRAIAGMLDSSLEGEKLQNDFLTGVPAIVEAIRSGQIQCRVYRKDKFHAKAYITHSRAAVIGSYGLVGSSNSPFQDYGTTLS
jgi:hypothetical protein